MLKKNRTISFSAQVKKEEQRIGDISNRGKNKLIQHIFNYKGPTK